MTEEQFLHSIEGAMNDFEANLATKDETIKVLLADFLALVKPVSAAKGHLELLILRVTAMRELQKKFFSGQKSVLPKSVAAEKVVDNALRQLTESLGYKTDHLSQKMEQKRLI